MNAIRAAQDGMLGRWGRPWRKGVKSHYYLPGRAFSHGRRLAVCHTGNTGPGDGPVEPFYKRMPRNHCLVCLRHVEWLERAYPS